MKANKLFHLAVNLAMLETAVQASDMDMDMHKREPQLPFGGTSLPPASNLFPFLACQLSIQIQNDINPIWSRTGTPPTCPPLFDSPTSSSSSTSPTSSSSVSGSVSGTAGVAAATALSPLRFVVSEASGDAAPGHVKRAPQSSPPPLVIFPTLSGNGGIMGDIVIGGGILPTLTIGGHLNAGSSGLGIGASATVGVGGQILPTMMAGGGAAGGIGGGIIDAGLSATVAEGGMFGLIPPANAGIRAGGDVGLMLSSGLHGLVGANGGAWATLGGGGLLMPSSTIAGNIAAHFGALLNNARATSSSSSSSSSAAPTSSSSSA
ncbi:hypothetical protein H4R21_003807 [Coemansia helicoidea]|uniref:Uncharacterized protein n=1 Tax=Coemansia helicoidea TaxID=1286919 RepID=A0ACC1L0Z2_9FUNG|nr:hypothetical protein H4R21_003807 [Coemansia helicoidea]